MGKGSSRRPTDDKKFSENFDRIFGKKEKNGKDKSNTKQSKEDKDRWIDNSSDC